MTKIISGNCFDLDLNQKEDLDFFFISSKDNIVINFENKLYCYKRKELIKTYTKISLYNEYYYILKLNDKYIMVTSEAYNHLTYNYYSIYKFVLYKSFKSYGPVYDVMSYKLNEYF